MGIEIGREEEGGGPPLYAAARSLVPGPWSLARSLKVWIFPRNAADGTNTQTDGHRKYRLNRPRGQFSEKIHGIN